VKASKTHKMSNLGVLAPTEEDIRMMLAANVHQGTRNLNASMKAYIWKRRQDGVHIINLEKTWEKLVLAARVIVTIENPADVCVISGRPYGQRAVIKFSQHTGATQLPGRFTPGTFTNQEQKQFLEPRLLILTDPRTDSQPLVESSYVSIPTICFCDTDNELQYVDIAIPANNKGKFAIGLMYWLLAREVRRMRSLLPRLHPWEVSVDLFFFRDPSEIEQQQQEQAERDAQANGGLISGYEEVAQQPDQWNAPGADGAAVQQGQIQQGQEWTADGQQAQAQGGFTQAPPAAVDEWAAPVAPQGAQADGFAQAPPAQQYGGFQQQQAPPADNWGAPQQAAPQQAFEPAGGDAFAAPQQQPW